MHTLNPFAVWTTGPRPGHILVLFALLLTMPMRASDGRPMEGGATRTLGRNNDPAARAMADSALAYSGKDLTRCLAFATNAIDKARRASDRETLHDALNTKRQVHYLSGEHELMLQTSLDALRVAQELGSDMALGDDHAWISMALMELKQPDKAYQHAQRSLTHMRKVNDPKALARGLCDMSHACLPVNKAGEALVCVSEAIRIYETQGDTAGTAFAQVQLGRILMHQERWNDALPVLLKANRYMAVRGTELQRCWIERDIAATYAGLERWSDVEQFLVRAELRAERLKAIGEYPSLLQVRIQLHEARDEHVLALHSAKRLIGLNDSLVHREVAGRIAAVNALHDTDRQEADLEQLRAENAALAASVGETKGHLRWWMAGVGLLVLVAGLALYQLRFNRKAVRRLRDKTKRIHELNEEVHARNIELERQRMRLAESLLSEEQKDLLLKEIHHRVKNNLQVVNTLLKMEAIHLNDPALEGIFDEAQGRVRSMALVHEHIYKVGDLSRVNVKAHVLALAEGILANHGLRQRVKLDIQVSFDKASVETLIPLSLLLNELLTNAAKHAFEGRSEGLIRIVLRRLPNDHCELLFSDDGSGLQHEQLRSGTSFGMELVRTFAEQLNGTIRLMKGEGTTFELTFRPDERVLRAAS